MTIFLLICFIAGSIGGVLQGMLGIGTGIIVIPLLTFILPYYGIPSDLAVHIALATSMGAITISSISSILSHHKHQNIQWFVFRKIVPFSLLGSCIGALLASHISARYLEIIFAFFIFFTAIRMLKKKKVTTDQVKSPLWVFITAGLLIGIVASILGIGGGLFMVPFLYSRSVEMPYAVGTSTLLGLPVAVVGTLTYIVAGFSETRHIDMMLGYLYWPAFLAISIGGVICGGLGVRWLRSLNPLVVQRIFVIGLIIVGIKMLRG